jgi:predicted F0F1-ATPase subunit
MHHDGALTNFHDFITMNTHLNQEINHTDQKESFMLSLNEKTGRLTVEKSRGKKRTKKRTNAWFYLGFVGEIGYAIALPAVGGALLGGYIDRRMSSYPKATLLLLFIGVGISILGFVRIIQELLHNKN